VLREELIFFNLPNFNAANRELRQRANKKIGQATNNDTPVGAIEQMLTVLFNNWLGHSSACRGGGVQSYQLNYHSDRA